MELEVENDSNGTFRCMGGPILIDDRLNDREEGAHWRSLFKDVFHPIFFRQFLGFKEVSLGHVAGESVHCPS